MKKILAMAAVAALAAGASVYAANPFSDVDTSDWAYQAISDLSDRGMVEGYPDGTFKGQQNITRFELAQIIARLMAKEDQMNAEDRAIIDRLASEYASELENLGVRVSNLEKKVGNLAWSGDARIRYQKSNAEYGDKDNWDARMRINVNATVNDTTYVHGRLLAETDLKGGEGGEVSMDRLYVHHQLGKVGATLGRYEVDMGQQLGGWLYSNAFDGIELAAPLGEKLSLAVGYGRMSEAGDEFDGTGISGKAVKTATVKSNFKKSEMFYAQLKADLKVAKLGVDYFRVAPYTYDSTASSKPYAARKAVWGVNLLIPVQQFRVFGDYYADTKENGGYGQKGKIWTAGLGYGELNTAKPGSFAIDVAYFKTKAGLYEYDMTGGEAMTMNYLLMQDGHFWLASADVALAKNTYLHGEYAFGAKHDSDKVYFGEAGNSWVVSLNYEF